MQIGLRHAAAVCIVLAGWSGLPPAAADDLATLRSLALQAVNAHRREHGLEPLSLSERLNGAAQAHAADMLERRYFEHASPEGRTVADRYADEGGPPWHLVAENLAQCEGCAASVTSERIDELERGWMDSPGHRANILAQGLYSFGYGITARDERLYAVQTFSGPGMPQGLQPGEQPRAVGAGQATVLALAAINEARAAGKLPPLQASAVLGQAARRLLPDDPDQDVDLRPEELESALPPAARPSWAAISVSTASCGGCGAAITDIDLRGFAGNWLNDPDNRTALLDEAATHFGFAAIANGDGRKLAVGVSGRAR